MKRDIHILLAGDTGIVPGLFVTIASLLTNCSSDRKRVIHFMNTGVSGEDCAKLKKMIAGFANAELKIHEVDLAPFKGANTYRGSYGAYARLLVGRYVDAPRVIYVDTDFLFLHDAAELYDREMEGNVLLATRTPMIRTLADDCPFLPKEETEGKPYLNSGILLIDLQKWADEKVEAKILELLQQPIELKHHDQTLLNYVLRGKWGQLDSSWGLLLIHDTDHPASTNFHFGGGGVKPWKKGCHYSAAPIWWAYYDRFVRPLYRLAGDAAIRFDTMRMLIGAHLLTQVSPMLRVVFSADKIKRMKKRDSYYTLMRDTARKVKELKLK